jgi:hypothetical protein
MKIKLLPLLLLLTLYCFPLFAQTKALDIIGEWQAVHCQILEDNIPEKDQKIIKSKKFEIIIKGFSQMKLSFKENKTCSIEVPHFGNLMLKELGFLKDKKWKIEGKKILVVDKEDDYKYMELQFIKEKDKTYFLLPESYMKVEVVKR